MLFRNGTTFKIYTVEILLDKLAVLNRWIYSNEAASYKTSNSSTTFFMGRRLLILTDRVTLNAQLITRRFIYIFFIFNFLPRCRDSSFLFRYERINSLIDRINIERK